MSEMPPFVPYATAVPTDRDVDHVRILSIMHYVWGGLILLFSSFFIIYLVIGLVMINGGGGFMFPTTGPTVQPPTPPIVGWMMAGMGGCGIAGGWTVGLLNIVVGRRLMQRRSRTLAMVVAGVNCLSVPLGTVLGVFTFIVLARDGVRAMFAAGGPPPA